MNHIFLVSCQEKLDKLEPLGEVITNNTSNAPIFIILQKKIYPSLYSTRNCSDVLIFTLDVEHGYLGDRSPVLAPK